MYATDRDPMPSIAARLRRRAARLLAVLAVCAPLALSLAPASASALTPPGQDPFYTPPANLAWKSPGTILRARQVTLSGSAQPLTADAYQLMFRTTSATGQPTAAVTTVLVPASPAPGARVLATYEPAYDSLTLTCAPSYTLQGGNNGGGGTATLEEGLIADELAQGWDVNVPDYEGLESEWAVGPMLGRASLDSVRATEHFAPDGLTQGVRTKVTFNGYSGGSEAADWAGALAPGYAPRLNIVGIAGGGNFPDFDYTLSKFDGSLWYGIEIGVMESFSRAYADFNLKQLLNAAGQALAAQDGADAFGCGGSTTNEPYGNASEYTNFPSSEALAADPLVKHVMARLSFRYAAYPKAPELLYNSVNDDIAYIQPVDALVKQYCAAGVTVDYDRDALGGDHVSAIPRYWAATLPYLISRFAGQPAPDNCATWNSSLPTP
jgi:Secretory lipase